MVIDPNANAPPPKALYALSARFPMIALYLLVISPALTPPPRES
jgi:hypothetical protein